MKEFSYLFFVFFQYFGKAKDFFSRKKKVYHTMLGEKLRVFRNVKKKTSFIYFFKHRKVLHFTGFFYPEQATNDTDLSL